MAYSLRGLIWRRGYSGGVSNLIYGGNCVSRSFSSVESVSSDRRMLPWLMLPPATEDGSMVYKFFSLAENRVLSFNWGADQNCSDNIDPYDAYDNRLVGSSNGWLCVHNRLTTQFDLINPVTRHRIKLPSLEPLRKVGYWFPPLPSKIILSCDDPEGESCRVLIDCEIPHRGRLAFCCPGRSAAEWTLFYGEHHYTSLSSVYSRRQKLFLCAMTNTLFDVTHRTTFKRDYLETWDVQDPLSPKMTRKEFSLERCRPPHSIVPETWEGMLGWTTGTWEAMFGWATNYSLVINDDTDDLFLVRRFVRERGGLDSLSAPCGCCKAAIFDVHKYDPESGSFRYMDRSLDGLSFFIGLNNGFALSAEEFPELKPNSIYYTDTMDADFGGYDIGIFNYEDATISPCYYPCDEPSRKPIVPAPRWFTPTTTTTTEAN